MKNAELYKKTTDILYQAYFNDTLMHASCTCCAVGNICAASLEYTIKHIDDEIFMWVDKVGIKRSPDWARVFVTQYTGEQLIYADSYNGNAKKQIDATGYTWQELAKIEKAFETAPKGNSGEDWMFNGLVAVLEVLKEIHKIEDDKETLQKFTVHHKTKINQPVEV